MRVIFSPEAQVDLRRIQSYISRDNPSAAARTARRLIEACDGLEFFPERGRHGKQPGARELTTAPPYLIVYRVRPDIVQILRIWHGRQDR